MSKYPDRKSKLYTENIGLRIEPELKRALEQLKLTSPKDVAEAIRMKIRELVKELSQAA